MKIKLTALRLRQVRRGISWREAALLSAAASAGLVLVSLLVDYPASWVVFLAIMTVFFVVMRLLVNRPPTDTRRDGN
jgi:hypothetical protein